MNSSITVMVTLKTVTLFVRKVVPTLVFWNYRPEDLVQKRFALFFPLRLRTQLLVAQGMRLIVQIELDTSLSLGLCFLA